MMKKEQKSYDDCLKVLLYGIDYAKHETNKDKNIYSEYKLGIIEELDEEQFQKIKILSLLENLGYPMTEIGTYFYQNVIFNVIENLDTTSLENILLQLKDYNSQFYLNISKNDFDINITLFNQYIKDSINKVNKNKTKEEYFSFSKELENMTYEEQTILLGITIKENKINIKKKIKTNI